MKIVILSDTHGNFNGFENVVVSNKDADLFLHLGDGADEYFKLKNIYKNLPIVMVKGNCDNADLPNQKIFNIGDLTMFACHGHRFNVKEGLDEYIKFAKTSKYNIIAYGHTHKRFIQKDEDLYIINPGSLTLPRKLGPSYCVLTVSEKKIDVKIMEYQNF